MRKKDPPVPPILTAVDNLTDLVELNAEEQKARGKKELKKPASAHRKEWFDEEDAEATYGRIRDTYKTVHSYLHFIHKQDPHALKERSMQKGIKSIIELADESAQKIEAYTKSHHLDWDIRSTKEYRELFQYYQAKIASHFDVEEEVVDEEGSEEEGYEKDEDDVDRRGLRNYETIKKDRDYELFFLSKEDGTRFYSKGFLRHLRLVANFDQILTVFLQDDPLVKIRNVQDKEAHMSACAIKDVLYSSMDHWVIQVRQYNDDPLVQHLFHAIMALFLAASKHNLISRTSGKSCLSYYEDFQKYLRLSLYNVDYQKFVSEDPTTLEPFYLELLDVLHAICFTYLFHKIPHDDAYSFFARLIQRQDITKVKRSTTSPVALCNEVLRDLDKLLQLLAQYPSGPLFKVLDVLQSPLSEKIFDPFMQGDTTGFLFELAYKKQNLAFYRAPTPTRQAIIHKAEVIEEFTGALRHCLRTSEKILLINTQDRTSWKESARSTTLEEFHRKSEVRPCIDVVTLPYSTEFYFQTADYRDLNDAKDFIKVFHEQIKSEGECGFYFPRSYSRSKLHTKTKEILQLVWKTFFDGKKQLSRKNRMDFIEIVYQFLLVELIDLSKPTRVVFCGKDSVDLATVVPMVFYAFIKVLSKKPDWKAEEKEHFVAKLFLPALLMRERSVSPGRLNRALQMLMIVLGDASVDLDINLSLSPSPMQE